MGGHGIDLSFHTCASDIARPPRGCFIQSWAAGSPKLWLAAFYLQLPPFNGPIPSVCVPLFDPHGFPLINYLAYRAQPSTPLMSEKRPRLYGACPPPYQVSDPHPSQPPAPGHPLADESPKKRAPKAIVLWLVACFAVVLFQIILMIAHIDVLEPFLDIESATRHASTENTTLAVEKGKMEHEREVMVHERELWEKAKEDRVPHGAFWEDVWPAWGCRAYGKREYWGALSSIPEGWSAIDACMNMPVEIKGVAIRRPYRCGYVQGSPHIHGYWMVDWHQPDCKPWFQDFRDVVGQTLSLFLPVRLSQSLSHYRDARATGPANVESRLRSWASTKDKEIGGCCAVARRWSGT